MSNPEQPSLEQTPHTDNTPGVENESDSGENYPQPAAGNKCAKDYDDALLQDCTIHRMRIITRQYEGISRDGVKDVLFRNIFNAMNDNQDCPQCPGGLCDPTSHMFPGSIEPPEGWVKGPNGLYGPPTNPPSAPEATITRQASNTGLPSQPGTSAGMQQQQTSNFQPFQPSSSAGTGQLNPSTLPPLSQRQDGRRLFSCLNLNLVQIISKSKSREGG